MFKYAKNISMPDGYTEDRQELWRLFVKECPFPNIAPASVWFEMAVGNADRVRICRKFFDERVKEFEAASPGDGALAYLNSKGVAGEGKLHPLLNLWVDSEKLLLSQMEDMGMKEDAQARVIKVVGSSKEAVKLAEQLNQST